MTTNGRDYLQPWAAKFLGELPDTILTSSVFEDYQKWLTKLLVSEKHKRVIIGAYMGSGKTAIALRAFYELKKRNPELRMLVVCPLNVAKDTWPYEILTWKFAHSFTYSVATGSMAERQEAIDFDADITIINRENYSWLVKYHRADTKRIKMPYDILVYDEASRLKGGKTYVTFTKKQKERAAQENKPLVKSLTEFGWLAKTCLHYDRVWELTGTPSPNGLLDLWGPIFVLDQGLRLGRTKTAYISRWFFKMGFKAVPYTHSEQQIMKELKDIFFYLKEEEYIKLMPLQVVDRYVTLDKKTMKLYRQLERDYMLEDFDVEAVNEAVLVNKLLQFCNGSIYSDRDEDFSDEDITSESNAKFVHDRKLKELESIFEETGDKSVLIAYSYRFDLHSIKKKFPFVRVYGETPHDLKEWDQGKLRAMILHPAAAGHGLNFQHGGHVAVWYGLNWSLELYQQFTKRLHRKGQKNSYVRMYRILARNTLDTRVADVLSSKGSTQDSITERVRVRKQQIIDSLYGRRK